MVFDLLALNSDASLNTHIQIGSIRFNPGDPFSMIFKFFQSDKEIRYVADGAATVTLELLKSDNSSFVLTGSFPFSGDRSIVQFNVSAVQSADLIGQDLMVKLDESGTKHVAILKNGLQAVVFRC